MRAILGSWTPCLPYFSPNVQSPRGWRSAVKRRLHIYYRALPRGSVTHPDRSSIQAPRIEVGSGIAGALYGVWIAMTTVPSFRSARPFRLGPFGSGTSQLFLMVQVFSCVGTAKPSRLGPF